MRLTIYWKTSNFLIVGQKGCALPFTRPGKEMMRVTTGVLPFYQFLQKYLKFVYIIDYVSSMKRFAEWMSIMEVF